MSKHVLITGGAGFIAHHVIDLLIRATDWKITTIDRLDYSGNLNRLHEVLECYDREVQKRVNVVFHDLKAEINPITQNFLHKHGNIDVILHLAASSHVDRSITHPMEFVMDNVVGACNILNFAREQKNLKRFIYFSTDEDNIETALELNAKYGVKFALLGKTFADAKALAPVRTAVCPEQRKQVALNGACVSCGICVKGNANIAFSISKK